MSLDWRVKTLNGISFNSVYFEFDTGRKIFAKDIKKGVFKLLLNTLDELVTRKDEMINYSFKDDDTRYTMSSKEFFNYIEDYDKHYEINRRYSVLLNDKLIGELNIHAGFNEISPSIIYSTKSLTGLDEVVKYGYIIKLDLESDDSPVKLIRIVQDSREYVNINLLSLDFLEKSSNCSDVKTIFS